MANIKHLRSLVRRSGLFFFMPHYIGAHGATKLKPLQGGLRNQNWNMQSAPVRSSILASHFSFSLALHTTHRLPSSSSSYNSSADEDVEEALVRSHSCSKLQAAPGKQLMPSSFKSLLYRGGSSHNRDNQESCKLHEFAAEMSSYSTGGSKYTRSWSSPSLQSKDGSRGRRCAPKGHVAVYVEAGRERHVVPIAYLNHPLFQALLERAQREYGFRQQWPGLRIPCSLSELHDTLHHIRSH